VQYYDLFACPLSVYQLWLYLHNPDAGQYSGIASVTLAELQDTLASSSYVRSHLITAHGLHALSGRQHLLDAFQQRSQQAARYWKRARTYIAIYRFFPFIRMLGVSGSLALDNARVESDIDIFTVCRSKRIWMTRMLVVGFARLTGMYRTDRKTAGKLCFNHFVTMDGLQIDHQTLYTAHLFSHLVPGYGHETYRHFQQHNLWIRRYVPKYPWYLYPPFPVYEDTFVSRLVKRSAELLLGGWFGDIVENVCKKIQLHRIARDRRRLAPSAQVVTTDACLRFHLESQEIATLTTLASHKDK